MVRVNKHPIDPTLFMQLLRQCARVLAIKDTATTEMILQELLGYEEQLVLVKRVAVIVLLLEGVTPYRISQTLKLSQSTIAKQINSLEHGMYSNTIKRLRGNTTDYLALLELLDSALHLGGILPHRAYIPKKRAR